MSERTLAEEFASEVAKEVVVKTVMWGPALLGTLLLGPLGFVLGFASSVAVATSVGGDDPKPQPPA